MPRLVYVVTHPMTARFLMQGQLAFIRRQGFKVTVISGPGDDLQVVEDREGVTTLTVPLQREMRPLLDAIALQRLIRTFRRLRPDIVNAGTPKAGLLGMVAARLTGVPVRIYTLRGLRLETTQGMTRHILNGAERLAVACAQRVLCVSPSLARTYVQLGFASVEKIAVLGSGSSNGVDAKRFSDEPQQADETRALQAQLGIPADALVIGFIGRFTRDKGIVELLEAFETLALSLPTVRLLLIGDFEHGDPVPKQTRERLRRHPCVVMAGFVPDTAPYYRLMDVVAFPSHREGFPNVPLEAAAAGLPVVGFRTTGTVDAVQDGVTGTLASLGDISALAESLRCYLHNPQLRWDHGRAARERVIRDFRQETVWAELHEEYLRLLRAQGRVSSPASTLNAVKTVFPPEL